jgi:phage/plasmid-associated DNA primase
MMSSKSVDSSNSNALYNHLNAKLDNNLQLKSSASYRSLTAFLTQYKCESGGDSNIIDQGQKIPYKIPDKVIPKFFTLLDKCRKEKLILNFSEKQQDPSGIMLDFDIEQAEEKSQLQDHHFYSLTNSIIKMIAGMLKFDSITKISTYVMFLRKTSTEFRTNEDSDEGYFKDGFHMLIPGIKFSKDMKKYLIKKILEEDILDDVFDDELVVNGGLNSIVDKNSAHVVTLFPGSCKSGKIPYDISRVYKVSVKSTAVSNCIQCQRDEWESMNIVHEFSVNYELNGGNIHKQEYPIKDEILQDVKKWTTNIKPSEKKINQDMSILSIHDPDASELKSIIDILDVKRCEEYKDWFSITTAIGYMGDRYKPIAYKFGEMRDKGLREEFERVWADAIMNPNKYAYSKKMIYYFARMDNPDLYKEIMNESIFGKITEAIFDQKVGGYMDHWHIAKFLKQMIGNKFLVDIDENTEKTIWYEFVLENDPKIVGEVYKWRKCHDPFTLRIYISEVLPQLFDRAIEYLQDRKNKSEDEAAIKYYNNQTKAVILSSKKLFNSGFKTGVIKESEALFREIGFCRDLDQEENIMGVGNGVLLFDKVPKLISSYHHYKISRYSPINYVPIDVDSPLVQMVFKSIYDLFPDEEKDVFHYLMYYFSTSLHGRLKACLFLALKGGGANGKSYLMELMRNLLGSANDNGYGAKLPIGYLIEKEPMTNNASPVLEPLIYSRLVYFSESDKSEQLRVAKMKKLTSQEPINVRCLFGKQRNIVHKSNFVCATNFVLGIDTTDHGTWRRFQMYIMKIKLCSNPTPGNKNEKLADPSFATKKCRDPEFLSAFLSILCMYLSILDMKYKGDITKVPCPTIKKETEEFRNSQDVINRFISERIVITEDENHEMPMTELVDIYCRWYDTNIREGVHDRFDINLMFRNSRLTKHVDKTVNGVYYIKGHRVLGPEELKDDNERFMVQAELNVEQKNEDDNTRNIPETDPNHTLRHMYDQYQELIERNNIQYNQF